MRHVKRALVPFLLGPLLACTRDKPRVDAQGEAARPAASVTVTAAKSPAGNANVIAKGPTRDAGKAVFDDLLHTTEARLAVSSTVANPHDRAEHIADGRLDTAWNGKTGDLVGAWFGFRVPQATRVRIIELTVGYAATSKRGEDLFAANHRIARVRVSRDGKALFEHAFDPDVREYQPITLDEAGGDFRIDVLAVKAGTRPEWRELVISELRVFGIAGSAKQAVESAPRVRVGAFDAPPPAVALPHTRTPEPQDAADGAALCTAWRTIDRAALEAYEASAPADVRMFDPAPVSCAVVPFIGAAHKKLIAPAAMSAGLPVLLRIRRMQFDASLLRLGVQYGGHAYAVGEPLDVQAVWSPCSHGRGGASLIDARVEATSDGGGEAGVAVFTVYKWDQFEAGPPLVEDMEPMHAYAHRELIELRCVLAAAGPQCTTKQLAARDDPNHPAVLEEAPPLPW